MKPQHLVARVFHRYRSFVQLCSVCLFTSCLAPQRLSSGVHMVPSPLVRIRLFPRRPCGSWVFGRRGRLRRTVHGWTPQISLNLSVFLARMRGSWLVLALPVAFRPGWSSKETRSSPIGRLRRQRHGRTQIPDTMRRRKRYLLFRIELQLGCRVRTSLEAWRKADKKSAPLSVGMSPGKGDLETCLLPKGKLIKDTLTLCSVNLVGHFGA